MRKPPYVLFQYIPFEGLSEEADGTLEELKEIIKIRGYSYYDLKIYSTDAPDIYELMKD